MKTFILKITLLLFILPFYSLAQNSNVILQETLDANAKKYELTKSDASNWELVNHHDARRGNVGFYYVHQSHNGVLVHNAISVIAIKDNQGYLTSNGFISDLESKVKTLTPTISAKDAILAAVNNIAAKNSGDIIELPSKGINKHVFEAKGLSVEEITVELKLFKIDESTVRVVWDLHIYQLDQKHWWSIRVDAQTGAVLEKTDWVLNCDFGGKENHGDSHANHNHQKSQFTQSGMLPPPPPGVGAGYNVFPIPVESPIHGSRQLVIDPDDPIASPYGWHDTDGVAGAEFTTTQGNNVYASEDRSDADVLGYTPNGGTTLNFDFPLNMNLIPSDYEDAAITNLFYMNNIMHDVWYQYGFDEASGNFQQNNYGNGGADDDHVDAQAQDGGGMNNANMSTGPDGFNPRMQMYLWSSADPDLLTINSPSSISGVYGTKQAGFGPIVPVAPITSDIALYDDNSGDFLDGCQTAINPTELDGKIVLVKRGGCNFVTKVENAENAGAIAVIVVNNVAGNIIAMGGTDPGIGVPSIMISQADGLAIITQIQNGTEVNGTLSSPNGSNFLDGDFDNGIIAHEYGHGVSIRLTGGASEANCLANEEQMGEGWSDWFGMMLTIEPGDLGTDGRGIGTFASGELATGGGIRPLRYSTDFNINNITYDATNNSAISQPHGIGFVWATMLWDLNWALINQYGIDADIYNGTGGNNIAMQLVIDGLKLQSCYPGFIDGRDAILQADQIFNNGDNQCLIWNVFAKRGLGYSANQGSSDNRFDQMEAFDLPPNLSIAANTITVEACNSYTWAENGQTYSETGNYVHAINNSTNCDSILTLELTIENINSQISYSGNGGTLASYSGYTSYQWIDCDNGDAPISGATNATYTPAVNGNYAVIITSGNCTVTSNCLRIGNVGLENNAIEQVTVYPNPSKGKVEMSFSKTIEQADIRVYDMTGKLVQEFEVIDVPQFSFFLKGENGVYTIELTTSKGEVIRKRISKID
ncbi:T9SS type A sorting domain-containing protein [Brumimicrobium glaciale]|uniref:T9SS type A sorting domain-containing protein n=1 Tax=Brumimicrobium glaciale TaxID=200475 RepID=A0A4Q4KM39_9FLAO|nr:T9SS-dependent M36 family metallopeptidase [Brumimicrobium glaciale]RYM33807.1 T9SS type A sorting domain-containing protein [Brumimicrobium glaciale]